MPKLLRFWTAPLVAALVCLLPPGPVAAQPAPPTQPSAGHAPVSAQPDPSPLSSPAAAASNVTAAPAASPAVGATNSVGGAASVQAGPPPAAPALAPKPAAKPAAAPSLPTAVEIAKDQLQLQAVAQSASRLQPEAAEVRTDDGLARTREDAAATEAAADRLAQSRSGEIAALDARLKRYSTASGAPRPHLSAAGQRDRADLLARRAALTGQLTTAERAAKDASGVYNAVSERRRSAFDAQIFQRTASPLEAAFWTSVLASLRPDSERLVQLLEGAATAAVSAPEPRGLLSLAVALALAFVLAVPLRRALKRLIRRRAASAAEAQGGDAETADGLYRSAQAVGSVLVDTLLPGAAAATLNLGLSWGQFVSDRAEALVHALVIAVFWGGAVVALSRQLAGAKSADERLLPVSERLAARMRGLPWLVALITGAGLLLTRINSVVGASVAATIAANCVVSLAYAGVASLLLLALGGDAPPDEEGAEAEARQPLRALLSLVLSVAILVTVGAVFAGFTTFAVLVSKQIFWIGVLMGVTYLLLRFADDVVAKLFKPKGWIGRPLTTILNLRLSTIEQLGVLVSALLQVVIVLIALSLALTPLGRNGEMLSLQLGHIGEAVHVGSLVISPRSVATGLASLLVGLGLVHLIERWLNRRYLPVTDWDAGVRNSVSTGLRYLGVALAILWALAAAGLGFKQIALVASALSVGIGFGLQQIVQNFVSGLILLVERPVKVGDWVNVGGVEGDVQRIRVRATEIRTFDRTTLIVPNSDLITKSVQNKTSGDPRGRVELRLTIAVATDAPRAVEVIAGVLKADEDVLDDPAPGVFVDSLTAAGAASFTCFAYVSSPRVAFGARSRLYLEVVKALTDAGVGFAGTPSTMVLEPGPELKSLVDGLATRPSLTQAPKPAGGG